MLWSLSCPTSPHVDIFFHAQKSSSTENNEIQPKTHHHCQPDWHRQDSLASAHPPSGLNLEVTPAMCEDGQETASLDHPQPGKGLNFPSSAGIHPFLPTKSHITAAHQRLQPSPKAPFSSPSRLFLRWQESQCCAKGTRALWEATAETSGSKAVLSISPSAEAALPGTCLLLLSVLKHPRHTALLARDKTPKTEPPKGICQILCFPWGKYLGKKKDHVRILATLF